MAIVIISQFKMFDALEAINNNKNSAGPDLQENWSGFTRISVLVCGRSITFFALNIFIPIYWIEVLGQSNMAGAAALSLFAGTGIFGNIAGGTLADRIGQKKVTLIGFASLAVLLPALIAVDSVSLATMLLVPVGFMMFLTYSPTIVLGQKYLPNRVGLSSGVTLGLSVAIGGGTAPFIGKVADIYGVWMSLASVSFLPVLMLLLAFTLPAPFPETAGESSRP